MLAESGRASVDQQFDAIAEGILRLDAAFDVQDRCPGSSESRANTFERGDIGNDDGEPAQTRSTCGRQARIGAGPDIERDGVGRLVEPDITHAD